MPGEGPASPIPDGPGPGRRPPRLARQPADRGAARRARSSGSGSGAETPTALPSPRSGLRSSCGRSRRRIARRRPRRQDRSAEQAPDANGSCGSRRCRSATARTAGLCQQRQSRPERVAGRQPRPVPRPTRGDAAEPTPPTSGASNGTTSIASAGPRSGPTPRRGATTSAWSSALTGTWVAVAMIRGASSDAATSSSSTPAQGRRLRQIAAPAAGFGGIAVSPDGHYLAAMGAGGAVQLFDPATGEERLRLAGQTPARLGSAWRSAAMAGFSPGWPRRAGPGGFRSNSGTSRKNGSQAALASPRAVQTRLQPRRRPRRHGSGTA